MEVTFLLRGTLWEKLSVVKANCGIELALECVAILSHMHRLKWTAERAAASSHGLSSSVRFNASKRIPSWNCIAWENSTGSLEEYVIVDVATSLHQGIAGSTQEVTLAGTLQSHLHIHDGSDIKSESVDLNSWTRSGGHLMRTTSADKIIEFAQNLDVDSKLSKGMMGHHNNFVIQMVGKDPYYQVLKVATPDRSSDMEFNQRDVNNRVPVNNSSIMVVAA